MRVSLTDYSVAVSNLRKQLATLDARILVVEKYSANLNNFLLSMIRSHGSLRMKRHSARAPVG